MSQASLFGPEQAPDAKQPHDLPVRMRVLITVKAAPNPSAAYGETVCVAGIRLDLDAPGWLRLYPINFRDMDAGVQFSKYEGDGRHGSAAGDQWRGRRRGLRRGRPDGWPSLG